MDIMISTSNRKDKKVKAVIDDPTTVHLGASGYFDFTRHKTDDIKDRYLQRYKKKKQKAKEQSNLTIMTIYLSLISIITHFGLCMLYVALTLALDIITVNYLMMFGGLSITAKHFSNFFVFLSFNSKFRQTLLGLIGRNNNRNNVIVI